MGHWSRHLRFLSHSHSTRVVSPASQCASVFDVGVGGSVGASSDLVVLALGSLRGISTSLYSRLGYGNEVVLRFKGFASDKEGQFFVAGMRSGARLGLPTLLDLGYSASASFPRSFMSRHYTILSTPSIGLSSATLREHGQEFCQPQALMTIPRNSARGDRGFAKAVSLPPQMQKPMRLRVYMGSPGVIGEPYKPPPPPLPFLRRWFTREGWRIRRLNIVAMLKTGFTLAKLRQRTKGYSQAKFYREATDLYKEINSALAQGDRSGLRQLVTDNVLTTMKKELKHREQAWARVQWELVGPIKRIRTLQGRLIGVDQKNMDTAFAQLTLRIVSNQKFAAYDKQGKLVAGDPEKELTVEDIWVLERQISQPEAKWRLCGRLSV